VTTADVVFVGCALVATAALVAKFRYLQSRWGSPRLWAICATLFFAVVSLFFAAPNNYAWTDRVTGVPNMGELLGDTASIGIAGASLTTALFWRYPARAALARLRWIVVAYAGCVLAMVTFFSMASVPEERLFGDFASHYATQPPIFAYAVIWLGSTLVGTGALAYCCFTWARHDDYANLPWLRRGLQLYGSTALVLVVYSFVVFTIVSASALGVAGLERVSRAVPILTALLTTAFVTAALVVPVWGPRWPAMRRWASRWRVLPTLHGLHRALRHVDPALVMVASHKRLDPHHRVRRMMIELSDWRWRLAPIIDPAVGSAAATLGRDTGLTGDELAAAVEAAQLKAASFAWRRGVRSAAVTLGADRLGEDTPKDGTDIQAELAWWVRVARAYRSSPVVAGALAQVPASAATTATHLSSPDLPGRPA
jgi:hypothetical protein